MTKEEAIEQLNAIDGGDPEIAHGAADNILLTFLEDNGFEEVAQSWVSAESRAGGFWYA